MNMAPLRRKAATCPAWRRRPPRSTRCGTWTCRLAAAVLVTALSGQSSTRAGESAPAWLEAAAAFPVPGSAAGARAYVLLRHASVSLDPAGRAVLVERMAVRILAREGRSEAVARVVYRNDGDQVRGLHAWLRSSDGSWVRYGRNVVVDFALVDDDVYNETRVRMIAAGADADSGMVFGCESILERSQAFPQFEWSFQDRLPTARSCFSVTVPPGWEVSSRTFNHAPIDSVRNGAEVSWELRSLAEVPDEPWAPSTEGLVARIGVTCTPPPDVQAAGQPAFRTWGDVSAWLARLNEEPGVPTPQVRDMASRLVAGQHTARDSLSSVARFAQAIRYISIQVGLSRGGGYRAHPAEAVMTKSYGDCKDKANLMRAMLASIGIPSWLVVVYSGDPYYVRESWPSPQQFNHCILAVRAPEATNESPWVDDPKEGRLVLFDPTDAGTPFGDLPMAVRGGPALLVDSRGGSLMRLPVGQSQHNLTRRRVRLTVRSEGTIEGAIDEVSFGQSASDERHMVRELPVEQYREYIRRWLWRTFGPADVTHLEVADDSLRNRMTLSLGFRADGSGQLAEGDLMVFRPTFSDRRAPEIVAQRERTLPVALPAVALEESVVVTLPGGYAIEEIPSQVRITETFGSYVGTAAMVGNDVVCARSMSVVGEVLPAERFPAVREFFTRIREAGRSPVVFARR